MLVHVVADTRARLSAVCAMLEQRCTVTSELLGGAKMRGNHLDAVVVAADLRVVENISAVKAASGTLTLAPKRVFLIDQKTRLAIVQAYALGATRVLTNPVNQAQLLAKLADGISRAASPARRRPAEPKLLPPARPASRRCSRRSSAAPLSISGAQEAPEAGLPRASPKMGCPTGLRGFAVTTRAPTSIACW